ncbi:MAG: transposase [Kouleothrix sp.]
MARLIANFEIAARQLVRPSFGLTRTEADFAAHIAQTIASDPEAAWLFITDQLNTHQSEALVRLVAEHCDIRADVGVKGKSGVLSADEEPGGVLERPCASYSVRVCTQAYVVLNQVEIWFSILVRRVIKRGNFTSLDDLRAKILAFVEYFNRMAKPFRWTYLYRPPASGVNPIGIFGMLY